MHNKKNDNCIRKVIQVELVKGFNSLTKFSQYLSDLTQMNHSAAAAYTSMAQPFGVSAHTPPHMPTVRQDSMSKLLYTERFSYISPYVIM